MTSGRFITQSNCPADELPVLAYWNYTSAPVSREQINVFINKIEEKFSKNMQVSFICDVLCTDTSVINAVEQEYPNFSIYHASPLKIVDRICTEMNRHTAFFDKPGLVVLISDSGNYKPTLKALAANGWRTLLICPNDTDVAFLSSAKECIQMDELVNRNLTTATLLETRCFLVQIPTVSQDKLCSLLSRGQHCVYFNSRSQEAVIVIEAENNDFIQRRLETLIGRICAAIGVRPSDMLPFQPNSHKRMIDSTQLVQLVILGDSPQSFSGGSQQMTTLSHSNGIPSNKHQFLPTYGPEPAPQHIQKALPEHEVGHESPETKSLAVNPSDRTQVSHTIDEAPPSEAPQSTMTLCLPKPAAAFDKHCGKMSAMSSMAKVNNSSNRLKNVTILALGQDPLTIGAVQWKERDYESSNHQIPKSESVGGFNAIDKTQAEMNHARLNEVSCKSEKNGMKEIHQGQIKTFGGDPWKKAEESFIRRLQEPLQHSRSHSCETSNSNVAPSSYYNSGIQENLPENETGGARENQQANRPDYSLLSYDSKQVGQRKQRERFRKPAPQCIFWENRHHRQETGCTLWHPRESCRFYPTCAHEARYCGFAHPFCDRKCLCAPSNRNPQMNHWTEELEKNFGTLSAHL